MGLLKNFDFDWEQYLFHNPDLVNAGINTQSKAWKHFVKFGKQEGRRCNKINNTIISGEKIQDRCDYCICSYDDKINNKINNKWIDVLNLKAEISGENIKIFCYTHVLYNNFENLLYILNNINNKFDIYFHNSDCNFLHIHYEKLSKIKSLNNIYSQNNIVNEVITLPIGQANSKWEHGDCNILNNKIQFIEKTNEIFLNFGISTPKRIPYKKSLDFIPWVENTNYRDYIDKLSTYKYCICVEGNGFDTHRFWECVYLKVIPICINNEFVSNNKDIFPMIVLDNWEELKNKQLDYNIIDWDKYKNLLDINSYFI